MHFGHPLAPFGLPLAHFWFTCCSLWLTFGSRWLSFDSLSAPVGSFLTPFGSLLIPKNGSKTFQKLNLDLSLILHRFWLPFESYFDDFGAASSSQYRLVSCFQMVRFNGQYLKVAAVAPQLQSADTGRCQAFQIQEAR